METNNTLIPLPKGWKWVQFIDLISRERNSIKRGPFGSAIKKSFFVEKGFKVYEQQNAIYDDVRLGDYYLDQEKFNELIGFEIKPGDFIVSCSGTIGRIARLPANAERGVINQALLKLTIDERVIAPKYFLELFRSEMFQKKVLKETRGTAMKNIASVEDLKQIPIALPSMQEQQIIISKLDELFSDLDVGVSSLKKAKVELARYRQSVLAHAFSGKLTEDWRKTHGNEVEPAAALLERIHAERRKNPKDKHKEMLQVDESKLPEGWEWSSLEGISTKITDGEHIRPKITSSGIYFLSAKDIRDEGVVFNDPLFISQLDSEKFRQRCNPEKGDILIVSRGATVGRSCVINTEKTFCLLGSVILMKIN